MPDDTAIISTFISYLEFEPRPSNQPFDTASNIHHLTPISRPSDVLNVSFVSDNRNAIDLDISIIEKKTPFEVFEQSLNLPSLPIRDINTTSVTSIGRRTTR